MRFFNKQGFTLIELLVTISVIGLIGAIAAVSLTAYRTSGRDSSRTANLDAIVKALNLYITSSQSGYPNSPGECLTGGSGAGQTLRNSKVMAIIPLDPRFPTTPPASTSGTLPNYATSGNGFCFYYSATDTDFRISFHMESDSGNLKKGINFRSPTK